MSAVGVLRAPRRARRGRAARGAGPRRETRGGGVLDVADASVFAGPPDDHHVAHRERDAFEGVSSRVRPREVHGPLRKTRRRARRAPGGDVRTRQRRRREDRARPRRTRFRDGLLFVGPGRPGGRPAPLSTTAIRTTANTPARMSHVERALSRRRTSGGWSTAGASPGRIVPGRVPRKRPQARTRFFQPAPRTRTP